MTAVVLPANVAVSLVRCWTPQHWFVVLSKDALECSFAMVVPSTFAFALVARITRSASFFMIVSPGLWDCVTELCDCWKIPTVRMVAVSSSWFPNSDAARHTLVSGPHEAFEFATTVFIRVTKPLALLALRASHVVLVQGVPFAVDRSLQKGGAQTRL